MSCIFCEIINKERKADIIYKDNNFVVFKDIIPRAKVHLLVVPKKHISSVKELENEDEKLMGQLVFTAKKIAESMKLRGYKILLNVGKEGGQVISHIHLHLLSGDAKNCLDV